MMTNELKKNSADHVCKYCNTAYKRETTLATHMCEGKRRWQQEKEVGVQLGLKSYLRFFEVTQGSAQTKSYVDFAKSPYYIAFVKFGRHCVGIRAINFASYLDWLLKNNKKLDDWCKDTMYVAWMYQYLRRESVHDALERALTEMQSYADDHPDLRSGFAEYFRYGSANRICYHITTGRVSPWIVYNCVSGREFLSKLTEEQLGLVIEYIDPDFWRARFQDSVADVEWCKSVLTTANL
jgi:hypothetical protein